MQNVAALAQIPLPYKGRGIGEGCHQPNDKGEGITNADLLQFFGLLKFATPYPTPT